MTLARSVAGLDHCAMLLLYRALSGTRRAEQAITDLANQGVLPGHHSGLGHETIGVAIGLAVRDDDCVQPSHRSGMMLAHARGGYPLSEAVLHKFGRAPASSAQQPNRPRTLLGVGLVGSAVPMAVGVALADQLRGRDSVTVTFFGDGAANEGAVHEAMNLAGARRLPVLFVLENNGLAISLRARDSSAAADLSRRADGYGIARMQVDGQDALEVLAAARSALARARCGQGPTLLEVRIERWEPHAAGFPDLRDPAEIAAARANDGLRRLRETILNSNVAGSAQLDAIDADCASEVDAALTQAHRLGIATLEPPEYSDADAASQVYAP